MATVTKTYIENDESSYKATWTWVLTESDVTISPDSVEIDDSIPINTIFPSSSIKMTYAGKNRGQVDLFLSVHVGNIPLVTGIDYLLKGNSSSIQSMVSGTSYAVTPWTDDVLGQHTLYYYNDYNSDILTVKWVDNVQTFCLKKSAIATLFDSATSELQLTVSLLYGYLASDKTTSTQTTWQNGITIRQGSITDTNIGLSLVTARLILDAPPKVTYGTPTYSTPYAGVGMYTVPLTSLQAQYGSEIVSATLTIGADSTVQTYSASEVTNQTISVIPSIAGQYTPTLTVTDSRGQTTTITFPQITVNPYNVPSASFDVYRTNDIGVKNDEGHYALIQATISYTDAIATLTEPSIQIDGVDLSSLTDASVTWYKTWSNTSGVSNVISDWTTLVPQNHMVTIYGLIDWDYDTTGNFAEDTSYQITLVANDSVNGHSTPITQTMSTAFYTIDFQAGGKEIAFGAPANDDLTDFNGKDYSNEGLFKCNMGTAFNDMTSQEVDDFVDALNFIGIKVVDFVIEEGTDGIWTYRKWNSGIVECWGTYEFASASFSATGQVFYRVIGAISFPSGLFVALPHIECSVQMGNPGGCSITNRSTSSVTVGVLSSVSTARDGNVFIRATSTWK